MSVSAIRRVSIFSNRSTKQITLEIGNKHTTISTEDSSAGVQISGNLIPSQNGVFQLGSSTRRWQTAFLSAETLDIGGATISSDGTGTIEIAATGATLPVGSKVSANPISILGATG